MELTRSQKGKGGKTDKIAYLFVAPALLFFAVFTLYPTISTFLLSLYEWDFLSPTKTFVGFDNFVRLFQLEDFYVTLGNTALYTVVTVLVKVVGGILLANFVFRHVRGKVKAFIMESALFMPIVIPMSVMAMIFNMMYDNEYGIINDIIRVFGGNPIGWVVDPNVGLWSVMILDVFKGIGFFFMISLVSMRNIPKDLYEVTSLEGASEWTFLTKVTVPLMGNTIVYLFVTAFLSSFQVFEPIFMLIEGKFGDSKITLSYMLWQEAFKYRDVGLAASLSIFIFVVVLGVTIAQLFLSKKVAYGSEDA